MTPSIPGITIYNKCKKENPDTGREEEAWGRTQIQKVHWTGADSANIVSMGLSSTTRFFCRIPVSAVVESNKQYINPPVKYMYDQTKTTWTASPGDYVFEGFVDEEEPPTETMVHYEVVSAADNRNSRLSKRIQHWRLDLR